MSIIFTQTTPKEIVGHDCVERMNGHNEKARYMKKRVWWSEYIIVCLKQVRKMD